MRQAQSTESACSVAYILAKVIFYRTNVTNLLVTELIDEKEGSISACSISSTRRFEQHVVTQYGMVSSFSIAIILNGQLFSCEPLPYFVLFKTKKFSYSTEWTFLGQASIICSNC